MTTKCQICGNDGIRYMNYAVCAEHRPFPAPPVPDPRFAARALRERSGWLGGSPNTSINDDRAIASGKRRTNPHARADAIAREELRAASIPPFHQPAKPNPLA